MSAVGAADAGLSLAMALVLNRGLAGLADLPLGVLPASLLGGSVAVAILWQQMFGTTGWSTRCWPVRHPGAGLDLGPEHALWTLICCTSGPSARR